MQQTAAALGERERRLESTLAVTDESRAQLQSRELDVSGLEKTLRAKYDEMQHLLDDAAEKKQLVAQVELGASFVQVQVRMPVAPRAPRIQFGLF